MGTRYLLVSAVTFSFACGFLALGSTYAENGTAAAQNTEVTLKSGHIHSGASSSRVRTRESLGL